MNFLDGNVLQKYPGTLRHIAEGWMKIWMKLSDGNIPQKDRVK